MNTTIDLEGTIYTRIGEKWYDENFIRAPGAIAHRLERRWRTENPAKAAKSSRRSRSSSSGSSKSALSHDDVFPVVIELIRDNHGDDNGYVTHRELVEALLDESDTREQIEEAVEQKGHTAEDWANWIVQWFSAASTAEELDARDQLERARVDGTWAYRPADA